MLAKTFFCPRTVEGALPNKKSSTSEIFRCTMIIAIRRWLAS